MDRAIPPSPPPSSALDPSSARLDKHSTLRQSIPASQPRCVVTPLGIVQLVSRPASRYQTPEPPDAPGYYPSPSMAYTQPPHGLPFGCADDAGLYEVGQPAPAQQTYNLNTPEASPPTPSHQIAEIARSRSASRTPRATQGAKLLGVKSGRIEKSSPAKRKADALTASSPSARKEKAAKATSGSAAGSSVIDEPLSILTKDWDIPAVDIDAYVHRSTDERIQELGRGKAPGKVKRAMNAFMLYRKAYQDRAKKHAQQSNHQVVSKVCGQSWSMEPESVRRQFSDWAVIERDNHRKAHPEYKFTPSKPRKKGKDDFDDESDLDDVEWGAPGRLHAAKRRSASRTPMEEPPGAPYGHPYPGSHHVDMQTFPPPYPHQHQPPPPQLSGLGGHATTTPYDMDSYVDSGMQQFHQGSMGPPQQYSHQSQHQHHPQPHHSQHHHPHQQPVENMAFSNVPPQHMALATGHHPVEHQGYDMGGYPYHGAVAAQPHPLGGGPPQGVPSGSPAAMGMGQQIDPSLVTREGMQQYDMTNPVLGAGGLDDGRWPSGLPTMAHDGSDLYSGPYLAEVDESYIQDSHLQYLRGDDASWKVGSINETEEWHPLGGA